MGSRAAEGGPRLVVGVVFLYGEGVSRVLVAASRVARWLDGHSEDTKNPSSNGLIEEEEDNQFTS